MLEAIPHLHALDEGQTFPAADAPDAPFADELAAPAPDERGSAAVAWEGPAMLGASLSASQAYRSVIASPPLTPEEIRWLDGVIQHSQGAVDVSDALANVPQTDIEAIQAAEAARLRHDAIRTLILRHLQLAERLAARRINRYDQNFADIVGTANLALVKAANVYRPDTDHDFCSLATDAICQALGLPTDKRRVA